MRRLIDRERLGLFMHAIARSARSEMRVYFVGGASAVLLDWRSSTIDIDLEMRPESADVLRAIPELKERLDVNVELYRYPALDPKSFRRAVEETVMAQRGI